MSASILAILAQATTAGPNAIDDDFTPGLMIGVLFFIGICLVLVGVGIVIGILAVAIATILTGLGVVSSSALIAIATQRWSAGLKTLSYQVFTISAAPCGILLVWVVAWLFHAQLRFREIVEIGLTAGIVAGLSLAFALSRIVSFVLARFDRRPSRNI